MGFLYCVTGLIITAITVITTCIVLTTKVVKATNLMIAKATTLVNALRRQVLLFRQLEHSIKLLVDIVKHRRSKKRK